MIRAAQYGRRGIRATKPTAAPAESNYGIPNQLLKEGGKDWYITCKTCGQKPTVHPTALCGPCCFGEASTRNGNW